MNNKALIIGPAWVGDMVMADTLVQLLGGRFAEIHMAAPPATAPVAERMPGVSQVHVIDFAHGELGLGKRRAVGRGFAGQGYEAAFVLPNSWKSALLPYFAGIPRRTGWQGEARYVLLNDRRKLDKSAYPLMIERFMALADSGSALPAEPYPEPRLRVDEANRSRLLAELELSSDSPVVLAPGAEFGAAKKWPVEHYAAVARAAIERGQAVWLLGSPNDADDCAAVAEAAPGAHNLAGRTRLVDAIDLISAARQVVCNDSGLMHVACAVGVPTVGIFGSTSAEHTPPLGAHAQVASIELDCRPCFQRECPLGHLNCLRQLHPEEVLAKLAI